MLSVAQVAFMLNVVVLGVVIAAERQIRRIVFNFATSRLIDTHKVPVLHDDDTSLPFIPSSIIKYRRQPAILSTLTMAILLLASELLSEIGVENSPNCQKSSRNGQVLVSGAVYTRPFCMTIFAAIGAMEFAEGNLKKVQAGFPFPVQSETCFSCIPPENEVIIGNCSIRKWRTYDAGQLEIGIRRGNDVLSTLTDHFAEVKENGTVYHGYGDVVEAGTGQHVSTLFAANPDNETIHYLEYEDTEKIKYLKERASKNGSDLVVGLTSKSLIVRNVSCEEKMIPIEQLAEISLLYRRSQIEYPLVPLHFNDTTREFNVSFTSDSLYRAVYGTYFVNSKGKEGSFTVYEPCGQYKWGYIMPMAGCCFVLFVLRFISCVRLRKLWLRKEVSKDVENWDLHARYSQLQVRTDTSSGSDSNPAIASRQIFDEVQFSLEEEKLSCANLTICRRDAH